MSETSVIDTREGVTLAVASRDLAVPAVTLRRWIHNGDLPAYRYRPRGPWRVMPEDVADLIVHSRDNGRGRRLR